MITRAQRPFGLWDSPLTLPMLADARRLLEVAWDDSGTLVWLEGRADRTLLLAQRPDGEAPIELTSDLDPRGEVGYGGGDFTVAGGVVYFAAAAQRGGASRLYRQRLEGGAATAITPAFGRAASPVVSADGRWVAYVHSEGDADRILLIDAAGRALPRVVAEGRDFYMQPRFAPDGRALAFIAWDHPNMPWDGTTLYRIALSLDGGAAPGATPQPLAGGRDEAIAQPEFSADGAWLYFVSDASGFPHLHRLPAGGGAIEQLTRGEVEYGAPAWIQGQRTYALAADGGSIYAVRSQRGVAALVRVDLAGGAVAEIAAGGDYTNFDQITLAGSRLAAIASSARCPTRLVVFDLAAATARVVARSAVETIAAGDLAVPEPIVFPTAGGETAHGLFYPPRSLRFASPGLPPLIVIVHGGPTSQAVAEWSAQTQFFTTRGYSVLQLNHRGSTGYGRAYMLRLRRQWGVCDVEDAVHGRRFLVASGRVDRRAAICGGSAGGYTVLQTLVDHPEEFAAGVSLYGIGNQLTALDTHKFESRYSDSLLGPLPEASAVYRDRSPVFGAARIRRPLAIFQGQDDKVVTAEQAEEFVAALRANRVPHIYHLYPGEGHGFRKRETLRHFYGALEEFLRLHVVYA